jgi:glycosyltransferase involved in cell wall biosynthesis
MRILFAAQNFATDGGAGNHVADSVDALRAAGHEVRVLAAQVSGERGDAAETVAGIDSPQVTPDAARLVRTAISDSAPHVVHVHDLADIGFIASLQATHPLAWTVHNFLGCSTELKYFRDQQECHRPHGAGCVVQWGVKGCVHRLDVSGLPGAYRRTTRTLRALRATGTAIVLSRFMADHLTLNGVKHVTIAPPYIQPMPIVEREPNRRLVFAGRVTAHKGIHVLIEAMRDVDATLDVCGDGWALSTARAAVNRSELRNRVHFHGWLEQAQVRKALGQGELCVVPSRWPEPFGLIGLEAMALGRPVVATNTGGIPEWLDHGRTGILVSPGSSHALAQGLNEILGDGARIREMGRLARDRIATRFTPEAHVDALEAAYAGACERFAGPGD